MLMKPTHVWVFAVRRKSTINWPVTGNLKVSLMPLKQKVRRMALIHVWRLLARIMVMTSVLTMVVTMVSLTMWGAYTDTLSEFGGDSFENTDRFLTTRTSGVATLRTKICSVPLMVWMLARNIRVRTIPIRIRRNNTAMATASPRVMTTLRILAYLQLRPIPTVLWLLSRNKRLEWRKRRVLGRGSEIWC